RPRLRPAVSFQSSRHTPCAVATLILSRRHTACAYYFEDCNTSPPRGVSSSAPAPRSSVMGQPAARITDMHTCPMVTGIVPHVGGPIVTGMWTVLTGNMPQARITDMCVCVGPPDMIVQGAFTVLVGGLPAARLGDMTSHGGIIVTGLPTVLIGDEAASGGGGGGGAPGGAGSPVTWSGGGPGG